MKLLHTVIGPIATNLYVLGDEASREAIAVDTARPCVAWLTSALAEQGWTLKLIVSSHRHWDHIGDNAAVVAETGAHIAVHPLDRDGLEHPTAMFFAPFEIPPSVPAVELAEGGMLRFGDIALEVLHTPGHTEGSVVSWRRGEQDCSSAETRCSRAGGGGSTCPVDRPSRWSRHSAASAASMATLGGTARPRSGHDDRARAQLARPRPRARPAPRLTPHHLAQLASSPDLSLHSVRRASAPSLAGRSR